MTAASCSDTWDEHYGVDAGNSPASSETIWDIIKKDSSLSNFAELAETAVFYRDEAKPQKEYTFKDLLNGDQIVTAFIPTNEALTKEDLKRWKEIQEKYPYTLHQQLMANTITLWRQSTTGTTKADTVIMLNGKRNVFDKGALTIGGSKIVESDQYAKNGIFHTISTPIPFAYNLYEFLKDGANAESLGIEKFHDLLVANDTTMFDENNSIEGNVDENGYPTYIDSVEYVLNYLMFFTKRFPDNINTDQYLTYNEGFGAPIGAEDSTFLMIIPTDNAYDKAFEKLKGYYKYADAYLDSEKGDMDQVLTRDVTNPDSLTEKSLHMDIFSPVVYNVNLQPNAYGKTGRWTMNDFLQNGEQATYFINTYGDTLRSDKDWQKKDLLQGTPKNQSNGCALLADTWNFPLKFYKPDVNVELRTSMMYNRSTFSSRNRFREVGFSNLTAKDWIDSTGRVSNDDFMHFEPTSPTATMNINFKLFGNNQELRETEVMSGKYDIYVVCVPSYYITSTDTINNPDGIKKTKLAATINYNDGNVKNKKKDATKDSEATVVYEGEKVDTILLIENFEFPYSYKNMLHSYPTLTVKTVKATNNELKNGYTHEINLDRIILKSKD